MEEWGSSFFEAVHGVADNHLGTPNHTDRLLGVFSFTHGRRFACGIYKFSVGDLRNKSELNSSKGFIKRGLLLIEMYSVSSRNLISEFSVAFVL
jgi:hypothetical protein